MSGAAPGARMGFQEPLARPLRVGAPPCRGGDCHPGALAARCFFCCDGQRRHETVLLLAASFRHFHRPKPVFFVTDFTTAYTFVFHTLSSASVHPTQAESAGNISLLRRLSTVRGLSPSVVASPPPTLMQSDSTDVGPTCSLTTKFWLQTKAGSGLKDESSSPQPE